MVATKEKGYAATLKNLGYFFEGDPMLERCLTHLWKMTSDISTGVRVIIHGQTGTGKEILAHAAHQWIAEKPGKMIPINCATLTSGTAMGVLFGARRGSYTGASTDFPGTFDQATDSADTVFLDEVHKVPADVRSSLLRVLSERKFKRLGDKGETEFNGNVIAASSSNLAVLTRNGEFPADLYYRLSEGGEVRVPSLKERSLEHRQALIDFGLQHWGLQPFTIQKDLREDLLKRDYPGNVRELRALVHQLSKAARFDNNVATVSMLQDILINRMPEPQGPSMDVNI